jgi:hypothetical protein
MNSNGSVYALSCIGRWVAYSIFWWSLSAVDALCKTLSHLAGRGRETHYAVTNLRYLFSPTLSRIAVARSSGWNPNGPGLLL